MFYDHFNCLNKSLKLNDIVFLVEFRKNINLTKDLLQMPYNE